MRRGTANIAHRLLLAGASGATVPLSMSAFKMTNTTREAISESHQTATGQQEYVSKNVHGSSYGDRSALGTWRIVRKRKSPCTRLSGPARQRTDRRDAGLTQYPASPPVSPVAGSVYSGGRIRTCDLRVMSPNLESRWTTWGTVSSGFADRDRLGSAGNLWGFLAHLSPQETARKPPSTRRPRGACVPASALSGASSSTDPQEVDRRSPRAAVDQLHSPP
jgi:hypothetical protein